MKLAATVSGKVSRADEELSSAVTLMEDNPESSPNASEWMGLPTTIDGLTVHSKTLELMALRRIAISLRDQILAEPNPRTVVYRYDGKPSQPPLIVDGEPVQMSYYIRLIARYNDADFERLLRTYKQKKMKDLGRLFKWSADVQEPLDQNGELFLKTRGEEHAEWRASESYKAHRAIMDKKFAREPFTPREITRELAASSTDQRGEAPRDSEIHEIVRGVIREYRKANPDCPSLITVNRGSHFEQVFIEYATADDLSNFVTYRRQQAADMAASADSAQKLLEYLAEPTATQLQKAA